MSTENKTNWGIIAPGNIAHKFADALNYVDQAHCHSVLSRSADKARHFADQHGFELATASSEAFFDNPDLHAVYIASPHSMHAEHSKAALAAGKAVLCEKPLTVNLAQAQSVIELAEQRQCFLMEAVWTRFLPIYSRVRDWLEQDMIGDIRLIQASFGFSMAPDYRPRLFAPELAGGSLLDVGIYPLSFAHWVMGHKPVSMQASGVIGNTGVDEQVCINQVYENGVLASLSSAIVSQTPQEGWIMGTRGRIRIPQFWCAERAELITDEGVLKEYRPHSLNGYEWEIAEVHRCLQLGRIQSDICSWQTSTEIMQLMDEVREQIGLRYPFE